MGDAARLTITSDDLRCRREDGSPEVEKAVRILSRLMESPENALEYRQAVTLDVMGSPTDPEVRDYLATLNSVWPLWLHFLARDGSLEFLIRALYGNPETGEVSQEDVSRFIDHSIEVVDGYYRLYHVPLDIRPLEQETLQYFKQLGVLQANT